MRVDVSPKQVRRGPWLQRAAVLLVLLVCGVVLGVAIGTLRPGADGTLSDGLKTQVLGPADDALPQLQIDVKFKALQQLRAQRVAYQDTGKRPSPLPSAQAATIRQGERQLDVALALAGPPQSRGPGALGRLLVDVRGEGDFAGLRAFVVEDARQPTLLRELLLYHLLARAGGIAPRTLALGLRVNGERWGTAVAVEQPSSALLTAAHRPLGALVGWEPVLPDGADLDTAAWQAPPQAARWSTSARALQGTPLEAHTAWAQSRLDELRLGRVKLEDALDLPAMAQLMALAELTGLAPRVLDWQSLRWYLNPVTLKLEPVLWLQPEAGGPQLRADLLLPQLLACAPLQPLYAADLQRLATQQSQPAAHDGAVTQLTTVWPTLAAATAQREFLTIRQRAERLLAAAQLPVEVLPPPPANFLPQAMTPSAVP